MRGTILVVGLLFAAGGALAQTQTPLRTTPTPGATSKTVQTAPPGKAGAPGLRASADNENARRLENERYKRWDDRMRRATRSMCDRC